MPINQFENFIEIFVIADIQIYMFAIQDGPNKQATVTQGRLPGQNLLTIIVTTTRMKNDSYDQVKHYAGDVIYNISGFIEKNRDTLFQDFKRLLFNSKNPVIIMTMLLLLMMMMMVILFPRFYGGCGRRVLSTSQRQRSVRSRQEHSSRTPCSLS